MIAKAVYYNEDLNSKENRDYAYIVENMDYVVFNMLNEDDRQIIYNEVILGRKGEWYLEYYAKSTYYNHSRKAYRNLLTYLLK